MFIFSCLLCKDWHAKHTSAGIIVCRISQLFAYCSHDQHNDEPTRLQRDMERGCSSCLFKHIDSCWQQLAWDEWTLKCIVHIRAEYGHSALNTSLFRRGLQMSTALSKTHIYFWLAKDASSWKSYRSMGRFAAQSSGWGANSWSAPLQNRSCFAGAAAGFMEFLQTTKGHWQHRGCLALLVCVAIEPWPFRLAGGSSPCANCGGPNHRGHSRCCRNAGGLGGSLRSSTSWPVSRLD